jgi:hypothetical protein
MGIANDFLDAFLKQNPSAREGKLSLPELNRLMAEFQDKANKTPTSDFDGLSPLQMHILLNEPLSPSCILRFKKDMEKHLDRVPLFKLSEILLDEIRDAGKLKLTAKGNLPVRVCELLCNQKLISWEYMQFMSRAREEEIPYLWPLKQYLLDQGIIKKQGNALSLTKRGAEFLKETRSARFIKLFFFFTSRFYWGNFYDIDDNGKCGQLGWAYSLVLLSKYGGEARDSQFYSDKLTLAFEKKPYVNVETFHRAYAVRFFECFANWFGLVNIERRKDFSKSVFDQLLIRKSELFEDLFEPVK